MDTERKIITSFKCTVDQFQERLKKYIPTNKYFFLIPRKIRDKITIMNLFIQGLDNKRPFEVKFPENLVNNYIKIISNIYHVNLTKTCKKFKAEVIDKNEKVTMSPEMYSRLMEKIFNDFYKENLKSTRSEVAEFFKITAHEVFDLPIKTMFRIYPYFLDTSDKVREDYNKLTSVVNNIIIRLENKEIVDEFLNSENKNYSETPKDCIWDFDSLYTSMGGNDKEEEEEEEEEMKKAELLNKYKQKYGKNKQNEQNED